MAARDFVIPAAIFPFLIALWYFGQHRRGLDNLTLALGKPSFRRRYRGQPQMNADEAYLRFMNRFSIFALSLYALGLVSAAIQLIFR